MDEHEDFQSDSSSDESRFEESSLDREGIYEEDSEVDEEELGLDDGRGDNTQEGLGDNDGGVQLEDKDPIFRPVWKDNAGGYLRVVRGCGSSTIRKRENQRKRELEKSASTTRSIVDMFSAQSNKTLSTSSPAFPSPASPSPAILSPKSSTRKGKETRGELQTQAAQELGELLRLKTVQMSRYGHVLDPKSNLYLRHQMVQSFLWMQLNKEKDNPGLDRQS